MDNYEISRDRAQAYFLNFDQEAIIRLWRLAHDEQSLYVTFLGKPYAVCRQTGKITRRDSGQTAGFEEVLAIFDLLCHEGSKSVSGHYAPVNSLKGRPRGAAVGTDFHSSVAAVFDKDPAAFRDACLALGGTPVEMGDIGFRFPLFGELTVILKFYHADEDFPASLTLLWDENTLEFMYYETVFYIAGFLLGSIRRKMQS